MNNEGSVLSIKIVAIVVKGLILGGLITSLLHNMIVAERGSESELKGIVMKQIWVVYEMSVSVLENVTKDIVTFFSQCLNTIIIQYGCSTFSYCCFVTWILFGQICFLRCYMK